MSLGTPDPGSIPSCGCSTPGTADAAVCFCGVDDLLRIIRRRYSLAVLNAIHTHRPARFHQIAEMMPKASSSTLADTLHALERARLITRREPPDASVPPVYELNSSGENLLRRLRRLLADVQDSDAGHFDPSK